MVNFIFTTQNFSRKTISIQVSLPVAEVHHPPTAIKRSNRTQRTKHVLFSFTLTIFSFLSRSFCVPSLFFSPLVCCRAHTYTRNTRNTRSSLAMARPSSDEPLHGVDANAKLVATMGKRPEEEDAAIAREWSPRGGRKPTNPQEEPLRACSFNLQGQRSVGAGWESSSSSSSLSPEAPRSCSLSPGLPRRDQRGRHHDVHNYRTAAATTAAPLDDDIFSNSSDGEGEGDDSDGLRFGYSPELEDALGRGSSSGPRREQRQLRGNASRGNLGGLGGQFSVLGSPYRTYRAKHARLLRARSSERAEAETRRTVLEHRGGGGASRSRSADSGVRSERWRGVSGMTSPLLQREGFGLLQSKTTGKVSREQAPSLVMTASFLYYSVDRKTYTRSRGCQSAVNFS